MELNHYEYFYKYLNTLTEKEFIKVTQNKGTYRPFRNLVDEFKTSYNDIYKSSILNRFFSEHDYESNVILSNIFFHINNMRKNGEQVFYLNDDFVDLFMNTDITTKPELFRLPYNSFVIHINGVMVDNMHVKDIYITKGVNIIRMMMVTSVNKNKYDVKTDIISFVNIDTSKGSNLESVYIESIKEFSGDTSKFTFDIYKLVVNTCLYLTSSSPDVQVTPRVKAHYSKKKQPKSNSLKVTLIGYNSPKSSKSAKGLRTIDKRFIVRGHWRNQACGEGRKERKLLFIEPFIKGSIDTGDLSRKYKLA